MKDDAVSPMILTFKRSVESEKFEFAVTSQGENLFCELLYLMKYLHVEPLACK